MRSYQVPAVAILILLLCMMSACSRSSQGTSPAAAEPDNTPQVASVEVAKEDLRSTATMPGSVLALESANLYAKVGGYLESISVDIGDDVEEGQTLAVINIPEMLPELREHEAEVAYANSKVEQQAAAVAQARAAVEAAEASLARLETVRVEKEAELAFRRSEFERWEELLKESPAIERRKLEEARYRKEAAEAAVAVIDADMVTSRARILEAQALVQKAEADEKVAKARVPIAQASLETTMELMKYAKIKAPFAGVITERHVHPGTFIMPATTNSGARPLLGVARVDRVRVRADMPMDTVAALNLGDHVVFDGIEAAPDAHFEGTITRFAGALGERSRMMRTEVEFDNPADERGVRKLRPGYYGNLTVTLAHYPGTPTVPASAVFDRDGETWVYAIVDGRARRRPVKVIFRDGARVGVSEGLSVGQMIVAAGVHDIEDGQRVRASMASGGSR